MSQSKNARPPFRADHVGSLLRPKAVHEARRKFAAGQIDRAQLAAVEDKAIGEAVRLQESVGLHSVTDGEFRRAMWHTDFLTGFDGIELTGANYAVTFKDRKGEQRSTGSMIEVTGKVSRSRPVMLDHFKFLQSATSRTAKFCMPAPTYLHMRGGRKIVDKKAYPDMDEFWADVTAAYRAEIADLEAAGCRYLQFDDVSFACLCDPQVQERVRADGEDPARLPHLYAEIINGLFATRSENLAVTVHTCRGNYQSMWMASGGYDAVAEAIFSMKVDGFFLEYDDERAGGFEPLRLAPKDKKVVLGLVSTKVPQVETKDELKRRIDEAAKFVPLENLCLSPQCGFASTEHGNLITPEIQRQKLERVVEVAAEVWG
ncbi:MAG TPA: 5-methyltetrahydropteroyltriglutamate--homocysteine S-methyltransferase [Hyphomicrobiales bacterium]|nr:5-methyltetrahydropteroyltriglutamate--homocysteine S-methyltransferase [Rhodobiaceae bacterium]HXK53797.1 5-methyltetrahydropteroyltriglutamate--homocysteine S-methyltransferase [Hyphomicrobiales bacterium]